MISKIAFASLLLAATTSCRDIPDNVRAFYNSVKSQGQCNNVLASGFYAKENAGPNWDYCGDHLKDFNVLYHQGKNGTLLDMDVDCDGLQGGPADDGRCKKSTDTQTQSSFQDTLQSYNRGIKDLNANVMPYVVFGNKGKKAHYATFDPEKYGVKPLSVIAVVCNNQLLYGIWGDENGDDDKVALVGEASISLATACFGKANIDGNRGYDGFDLLYIAFIGDEAVPGANGAAWNATSYTEFAASIQGLGDRLVQRLGASQNGTGQNNTSTSASGATPTPTKDSRAVKNGSAGLQAGLFGMALGYLFLFT